MGEHDWMEEFSALAARVAAGVGELRGCLILSRDGLVLGAFPEGEEALVKPAWLRFATLGEPDKGFVEFGDEVWGYVRRGPYAAFAVTGTGTRPGLLIDQLEQVLLSAEEARSRREALRLPEVPAAPSGKPRTSLHPEVRPPAPFEAPRQPAVAEAPGSGAPSAVAPTRGPTPPEARPASIARPEPEVPVVAPREVAPRAVPQAAPQAGRQAAPQAAPRPATTSTPTPAPAGPSAPDPGPAGAPGGEPAPSAAPSSAAREREEDTEVDRVLLAQEFSKLLQEMRERDEE
jgi:hypothetical protein